MMLMANERVVGLVLGMVENKHNEDKNARCNDHYRSTHTTLATA